MITSNLCTQKYGWPTYQAAMVSFVVPSELRIPNVPGKICNREMVGPLKDVFKKLIETGLDKELKTWDGCFNIRMKRNSSSYSLHSWGVAVDVNAAENPMGAQPKLSKEFVQVWKDCGFDWGGDWKSPDGMHLQLSKI